MLPCNENGRGQFCSSVNRPGRWHFYVCNIVYISHSLPFKSLATPKRNAFVCVLTACAATGIRTYRYASRQTSARTTVTCTCLNTAFVSCTIWSKQNSRVIERRYAVHCSAVKVEVILQIRHFATSQFWSIYSSLPFSQSGTNGPVAFKFFFPWLELQNTPPNEYYATCITHTTNIALNTPQYIL